MRLCIVSLPLVLTITLLSQISLGQSKSASSFEKAVNVDSAFRTLNGQVELHIERGELLAKQWKELRQRLADNQADMQGVVNKNNTAYTNARALTDHALAVTQVARALSNDRRSGFFLNSQFNQDIIALSFVNDQLKDLDSATKSILDRQYKILSQMQTTSQSGHEWIANDQKLLEQYIEQADLEGVQSDLQLKAAARVLKTAHDNDCAKMTLAITLMRLDQTEDAKELIEGLLELPRLKPLALAVLGEMLARAGEELASKKQFAQALQIAPKDPIVRMLRARMFNIIGDHKSAVGDWELLLRSGKYEIAAHRGLALTLCNFSKNQRACQEALKHAKLANSLGGETDWSCQITLALATAHNGDLNEAFALAERAADAAITDNRVLCCEIAEELQAGRIPNWKY